MSKIYKVSYLDESNNQRRAFIHALDRHALESHILNYLVDFEITRIEQLKK